MTGLTHFLGARLQFGQPHQQLKWLVHLPTARRFIINLQLVLELAATGEKKPRIKSVPLQPWPSTTVAFSHAKQRCLVIRDLALDILLPVDKEKEEAEKAAHARKMASGATANQYQPPSQQLETAGEEGDADDRNENNENDDDEMPEEREGETSFEDEDE